MMKLQAKSATTSHLQIIEPRSKPIIARFLKQQEQEGDAQWRPPEL